MMITLIATTTPVERGAAVGTVVNVERQTINNLAGNDYNVINKK